MKSEYKKWLHDNILEERLAAHMSYSYKNNCPVCSTNNAHTKVEGFKGILLKGDVISIVFKCAVCEQFYMQQYTSQRVENFYRNNKKRLKGLDK